MTPYKLIRIEERIQRKELKNCVQKVKAARIENYEVNHGSEGELSSEVEDPMKLLYKDLPGMQKSDQ